MSVTAVFAAELGALAALALLSLAIDRRYRGRRTRPQAGWQRTAERFTDPASGELLEVWYDPASGERDYRPAGGAR